MYAAAYAKAKWNLPANTWATDNQQLATGLRDYAGRPTTHTVRILPEIT